MLRTKLGQINLRYPFMNAAGPLTTSLSGIKELINKQQLGCVVTKSFTLNPQPRNPYPNVYYGECQSINNIGLENHGLRSFLDTIQNVHFQIPLVVSIADPQHNIDNIKEMMKLLLDINCSVELNLSCPNIKQSKIRYYDLVYNILTRTEELLIQKNVGIKLPYLSTSEVIAISNLLNDYKLIDFVVCINTIEGMMINNFHSVINSRSGGIGGRYLKPFGLKCVNDFYNHLNKSIGVIGCGGVQNVEDIVDYVACGASAVQCGTYLFRGNKIDLNNL